MFELSHIFSPDKDQHSSELPKPKFSLFTMVMVCLVVAGLSSTALGLWYYYKQQFSHTQASAQLQIHQSPQLSEITIDISGAVNTPGVYSLSSGARIANAVALAGGFAPAADVSYIHKSINLAKQISDGDKVYIPFDGTDTVALSAASANASQLSDSSTLISINTATQSELETLPSIGKVTAEKIINQRPFAEIGELLSKKVVGEATFQKIEHLISL